MHNSAWYKNSAQKALTGRYWLCVLAALIAGVLGGAASVPTLTFRFDVTGNAFWRMIQGTDAEQVLMYLLTSAAPFASLYAIGTFIIGGAVEQGYDLFNIAPFTGDAPQLPMLFSRVSNFGKALGLRLLMALKIFAWTLLFIVPGIIARYRYALAPFLMAEYPELSIMEAIERSKAMMQGKKWQLFCLNCSFIGWYLLVGLTAGIGAVFLAPYVKAAETSFYLDVSGRMKQS